MSETRTAIADVVRSRPGIHVNELVRSLVFASRQVQYHLGRLADDRSVVAERLYGRTHFYPPTDDDWERRALALLCRETAGNVVAYLLANGPARPTTVAADLDGGRPPLSGTSIASRLTTSPSRTVTTDR